MAGDQGLTSGTLWLALLLTCLGLSWAAPTPPLPPEHMFPSPFSGDESAVICGDDICWCSRNEAAAYCFDIVGDTYIPRLPFYVTFVWLYGYSYGRITSETMSNLTRLQLETLKILSVNVSDVDPEAFVQLSIVEHLIVGACKMSQSMLQAISHLSLTSVEFAGVTLESALELSTFENMTNLSSFKCYICSIWSLSTSAVLPRLETFLLSSRSHVRFPDFCPNDIAVLPSVRNLTIGIGWIVLEPHKINCLSNLTFLDLRGSVVSKLFPHSLINLKSLLYLKTSEVYAVSKTAFTNSNVREVELGMLTDTSDNLAFTDCPNMERLQMNFVTPDAVDMVKVLAPSLKYLHLTSDSIVQFPEVLASLSNLEELSIQHSHLSQINGSILGNMTSLTKLILNGNYISSINADDIPSAVRKRLRAIDLSDNPLECSCNILWLKNWIHSNPTYFKWYPKRYVCNNRPYQAQTLQEFSIADLSCLWVRIRGLVIALSVVFGVLIVVLPLVYRYRWRIQYYVFMLRYKRRGQDGNQEEEPLYRYDAFVSYDSHNHAWVRGHLMAALEGGAGLRLCIHERDFLAGKLIVDNIVDSIQASRKVIVVLSESFAASEWCQFELSLTHRLTLERGRDLMVLVLLEEIPRNRMTKLIFAVLKTFTYISWPEEERAREDFFRQLAEVVR